MTETQATINQWQAHEFPDATVNGVLTHLQEEFDEFNNAPTLAAAAEEAADVVILLYCWAGQHNIDLHTEIDKKMSRNRSRRWHIQPDGTGRHVK